MKHYYFLFLSLLLATLSSCKTTTDKGEYMTYTSENFVLHYVRATSLSAHQMNALDTQKDFNGAMAISVECDDCIYTSEMDQQYHIKYYDYQYNKPRMMSDATVCYVNDFVSIDIISDTDFNDIPAGQSLASTVKIVAVSPYRWLVNGETNEELWKTISKDWLLWQKPKYDYFIKPEYFPVNSFLYNLNPEDLKLLHSEIAFVFTSIPNNNKKHNLKIIFHEANSAITAECAVDFNSI